MVRQRLAIGVDAILHCGAFVHHLHNYAMMKAANVDSTSTLLELALTEKQAVLFRVYAFRRFGAGSHLRR